MDWLKILEELHFRTSRSSGAGGQHVNKTESKVEVLFNVEESEGLSHEEKEVIREKLAAGLLSSGWISVRSQRSRSQHINKEEAIEKLRIKLEKALTPQKKRKKTRPPVSSVEERLAEKKLRSEIKASRRKPGI